VQSGQGSPNFSSSTSRGQIESQGTATDVTWSAAQSRGPHTVVFTIGRWKTGSGAGAGLAKRRLRRRLRGGVDTGADVGATITDRVGGGGGGAVTTGTGPRNARCLPPPHLHILILTENTLNVRTQPAKDFPL
jgi:hypothetical protein